MSDSKSNSTEIEVPSTLSPVVLENKLGQDKDFLSSRPNSSVGQAEVITLVEEGYGIFSLEQGKEMRNKELVNVDATKPTFGRGEVDEALSVQKKGEVVRERLNEETVTGKSIIVIVSSTSNLRIFSNPKTTRSLLENSEFKDYLLGPIEVKGKGKSIKIEVKFEMGININFKQIKSLGCHPVNVWSPDFKGFDAQHKIGVISPIDLEINLAEEFLPYLKVVYKDTIDLTTGSGRPNIVEVHRMKSKGKDLELVKLVFEGEYLPEKILWDNMVYKVRPYIYTPLRCYKCQDYGHGRNSCTGRLICPLCLESHKMEECPRNFREIECYKCGLNHMVGDHSCDFHKHAVIIEGKKRRGEITYAESKRRFNSLNRKSFDDLWYSNKIQLNNEAKVLNTKKKDVEGNTNKKSCDVRANGLSSRHLQTVNDIESYNKWDALNDFMSDISHSDLPDLPDLGEMADTSLQKECDSNSKAHPKKVKNIQTYANKVKSPKKNKIERRDNLNNSPGNVSADGRVQINAVNDARTSSDREPINRDRNINNSKYKGTSQRNDSEKNLDNDLKSLGTDSPSYDYKDSFFYYMLNKIKRFAKKSPVMSYDQWVSLTIDLFEFVSQFFEIEE